MFVVYLSSEKNAYALDVVTEDLGIALHRFVGGYSLIQLVGAGYQTVSGLLPNAAYLAIDIDCIMDEDLDFISGLQSVEMRFDARVILISEGQKRAALLSRAAHKGFYNIVTATRSEEQGMELRLCIEGEGMSRQDAKRYMLDEEALTETEEKPTNLRIGFCGAIHRTGTTALSLQMASYLQMVGRTACMVEANDHGHIATIGTYYHVEKKPDDALDCSGLTLYPARMPTFRPSETYDAICYDFGMLEEIAPDVLAKCDLQVVCIGAKPWESHWLPMVFDCAAKFDNLSFVFSFVPADDQDVVRKMMEKYADRCYFAPYAPDLLDGQTCSKIFTHMLARQTSGKKAKRKKE